MLLARPMATDRARAAPSEPSLAIRILLNMLTFLRRSASSRAARVLSFGMNHLLGNERRHDGAADDRRYQDRVLALVDDVIR